MQPGDPLEPPHTWLPASALAKLARRVERLINHRPVEFDTFTPDAYLEGELGGAALEDFAAEVVVIDDAWVGDEVGRSASYGVVATVAGTGDAHWHATLLTGGDFEAFSGRIEGENGGAGLVQDVDGACECEIRVSAVFVARGRTWSGVEIDHVALSRQELETRLRRHEQEEFRRGQDLGLWPSDDELDER